MGGAAGGVMKIQVALVAAAIVMMVASGAFFAGKADARANIQDYFKGPNGFYPSGHDRPGPVNLTIDTVGWNATRVAGNLGIGNGSVRTFDQTSTYDVEYPENEFMCGDVSTQPWVPGLKTEAPRVEKAAEENATGDVNTDLALPGETIASPDVAGSANRFAIPAIGGNATISGENTTYNLTGENAANESGRNAANATNKTAPANKEQAAAAFENLTFAAYHPIQYLRPVKDILYEHPLATSGTTYCQLLGFETPGGDLVNVGMKCTGYGY